MKWSTKKRTLVLSLALALGSACENVSQPNKSSMHSAVAAQSSAVVVPKADQERWVTVRLSRRGGVIGITHDTVNMHAPYTLVDMDSSGNVTASAIPIPFRKNPNGTPVVYRYSNRDPVWWAQYDGQPVAYNGISVWSNVSAEGDAFIYAWCERIDVPTCPALGANYTYGPNFVYRPAREPHYIPMSVRLIPFKMNADGNSFYAMQYHEDNSRPTPVLVRIDQEGGTTTEALPYLIDPTVTSIANTATISHRGEIVRPLETGWDMAANAPIYHIQLFSPLLSDVILGGETFHYPPNIRDVSNQGRVLYAAYDRSQDNVFTYLLNPYDGSRSVQIPSLADGRRFLGTALADYSGVVGGECVRSGPWSNPGRIQTHACLFEQRTSQFTEVNVPSFGYEIRSSVREIGATGDLLISVTEETSLTDDDIDVVLIPSAHTAGDMNCDGALNNGDIDALVEALTNRSGYEADYPGCSALNGDVDGDGQLTFFDVDPFLSLLLN